MACTVMACMVMAYIVMAYIVMARIVMAYIVMADQLEGEYGSMPHVYQHVQARTCQRTPLHTWANIVMAP